MNDLAALLPLVAILALFWFLVVRPQRRRQKEVVRLQDIEVGQRVMMSSGIFGTVISVVDDRARLEIVARHPDRHRPRRDRQVDEPLEPPGPDAAPTMPDRRTPRRR